MINIRTLLKKLWNVKVTVIPIVIGALGSITKRIGKGTGRFRNQRTSRDHPDYSITKIGKNTEKSPAELRRLAITQTLGKTRQLTLEGKTFKGVK